MRRFILALCAVWLAVAGGISPAQAGPPQQTAVILTGVADPYPTASVALDFVGTRGSAFFKANGVTAGGCLTCLPGLTVTRASGGYAEDQTGALTWFNSGQARWTNKGLLVEEARTNVLPRSASLSTAATLYGAVTATGGQADPAGGTSAIKLDGVGNWAWGDQVGGLTAGQQYTGSWYVRADAPGTVDIQLYDGTTVVTVSKNITTTWTRISTQQTIAGTTFRLAVAKTTSQTVYVAFAQVELGAFVSSYIPTTTASATRAADIVRLAGSFVGPTGYAYGEWLATSTLSVGNPRVLGDNLTAATLLYVDSASTATSGTGGSYNGTTAQATPGIPQLLAAGTVQRGVSAWDGTGRASAFNGVTGFDALSIGSYSGLTLGSNFVGGQFINSYIRLVVIGNYRPTASALQTMTYGVDFSSLDLNFAAGSYKLTQTGARTSNFSGLSGVSVSRASTGYAEDSAGNLISFGTNVARITDKGLLVEEARTNLLLRSQEFENAAWSCIAAGAGTCPTRTANYSTAPDGTLTADRIQYALNGGSIAADISGLQQNIVGTSGVAYSQSIYLKSNMATNCTIQFVENSVGGTNTLTVTPAWQRFTLSVTSASTAIGPQLRLRGANGNSDSCDLSAWGGQLEAGAFTTSYIATTSASATRPEDVISLATSLAAPYTLGVQSTAQVLPSNTNRYALLTDGTNSLGIVINAASAAVLGNGVTTANFGGVVTNALPSRFAINNAAGAIRGAGDGSAVSAFTGTATIGTATQLYLGNATGGRAITGYLQRLTLYPYAANDNELTYRSAGNW